MTDNNDSLIREVQEELEREKYARLWERYGSYLIGAAVAVVVGVGGYKYWEGARSASVQGAASQYETALDYIGNEKPTEDDKAKAKAAFEALAKDAPGGYRTLGQLQLAGAQVAAGDTGGALEAYDALAKRGDADSILRDFAALQAATLRAGDADWTEMENRLTPLLGASNAWRHSARQLLGITAFKAGKIDKAREVFEVLLGNPEVPASVRERVSLYMARIVALEMAAQSDTGNSDGSSVKPTSSSDSDTPTPSSEGDVPKPSSADSSPAAPTAP